jgi:geranylgeranyl diphosphate synthase type II
MEGFSYEILQTFSERLINRIVEKNIPAGIVSSVCKSVFDKDVTRAIIILGIVDARKIGLTQNAMYAAVFAEFLYTSLVIMDNLPYMNNDLIKKTTICDKYGSKISHITSFYLISVALQALSVILKEIPPEISSFLLDFVAEKIGPEGFYGGEMKRIDYVNMGVGDLDEIISMKVSYIFEISFVLGWILGGGNMDSIQNVMEAGRNFGIAYQIICNMEDVGKDYRSEIKTNYVVQKGSECSRERYRECISRFEEKLPRSAYCFPLRKLVSDMNDKISEEYKRASEYEKFIELVSQKFSEKNIGND